MLYEILYPLSKYFIGFNLFRYISFRAIFAALTAFLVCVVVGPGIIRLLRYHHFGERCCSGSAEIDRLRWEKHKTPTMGGVIILLAIVVSVLLFGRLDNLYVILGLWTVVAFSVIGAADDWIKLTRPGRGMKSLTKLKFQSLVAAVIVFVLYINVKDRPQLTSLQLPLVKDWVFDLGPLYLVLSFLVIVGTTNGVNFTDGMDGLAIGGVTMTGLTFLVITYIVGQADLTRFLNVIYVPGASELTGGPRL